MFFPNTAPRVKAVRYHDLHHVLTGYATTNVGEAEIGAWEVATGCKNFWAAWVLNLMAMSMGLVIAPGKTAEAFYRGRHCKNLYGQPFDDALLDSQVGEQREQLDLDEDPSPEPTTSDRIALMLAYACGVALSLGHIAVLGLLAWLAWRLIF